MSKQEQIKASAKYIGLSSQHGSIYEIMCPHCGEKMNLVEDRPGGVCKCSLVWNLCVSAKASLGKKQ